LTSRKEEPGYYAVIPSNVRYDKSLSPNAKLLYGEITALCKKEGYCWASNSYFAELYNVQRSSITNWIKSLVNAGYINVDYIFANGKPNIEMRKIFLAQYISQPEKKPLQQDQDEETVHEADGKGGDQIIEQGGQKNDQGVVKFLQGGGQKTRERIIQANNKKAVAADLILPETEKPPSKAATEIFEEKTKENESHLESSGNEDVENLKRQFKQLDTNLVFDESFYPKILNFLSVHKLDIEYISWFYRLCRKKNPHNLAGYYFKTFLENRYVELYREASKASPVYLITCPVCFIEHNAADPMCPRCALAKEQINDMKEISFKKQLFEMKPETRKAYEAELELVIDSEQDFIEKLKQMASLKHKYGLLCNLNKEGPI